MVVQMPCPGKTQIFAASSVANQEHARREVQLWADGHGYRLAQPDRPFTIYHDGQAAREWSLLESKTPASGTGH